MASSLPIPCPEWDTSEHTCPQLYPLIHQVSLVMFVGWSGKVMGMCSVQEAFPHILFGA